MPQTSETETKPEFAEELRAARKRAHLTQEQVAERTQGVVPQNTISNWEKGVKPPREHADVFAVERAIGMPPGALSAYLGYVPWEVVGVSVETAIAADRRIDRTMRKQLLDVLARIKAGEGATSEDET